jgi:hypothetical protein
MKADLNEWNIVLVGQWNPHIFSPKWMCDSLLGIKEIESEFAIGPMAGGMRYLTNHLLVIPAADRVVLGMRSTSDATLLEAERVAIKMLELLEHTPVRASGINFSFIETEPPGDVLENFKLKDDNALADAKYSISRTEITRDIKVDNVTLKLKMVHSEERPLRFHFNFHHPVESAKQAASTLKDKILLYREKTLSLLTNSYHLTLEEEADVAGNKKS